jgi:hypothetical protein
VIVEALAANGIIRNWSLPKFKGLAICDDTPRINLWFGIVDQMADRVGKGGDVVKLQADLHDFLFEEAPLQLTPHTTAIKNLQDAFGELCELLKSSGPAVAQESTPSTIKVAVATTVKKEG